MSRAALALAVLSLVGCASAAPSAWLLYSKASYMYGRIEAKAETHCAAPVPADRVDVCAEATRTQQAVQAMAPLIQAELSKSKPDWAQVMRYVDLVFSLAAKFI